MSVDSRGVAASQHLANDDRPVGRLVAARGERLRHPLTVVLLAGLVIRMVLVPITHGQDFVVWDLASRATLSGINVYAHHPAYPGGPYAYFPLFLYVELPWQFLAMHGVASFVILGKLPIVGADTACCVVLWNELRRRGCERRTAALGAASFYLNPLVLYNGAFYGRFDSVACALLLLAVAAMTRASGARGTRATVVYALAVAAKTYAAFLLPWCLARLRGSRARSIVAIGAVLVLISLPYLAAPVPFVRDIVGYDASKPPGGLSWLGLLGALPRPTVTAMAAATTLLFAAVCIALRGIDDGALYASAILSCFLATSTVVLEQYLLWPMPFLILVAGSRSQTLRRAAVGLLVLSTTIGLLDNENFHPFGRDSVLAAPLAVSAALYVVCVISDQRSRLAVAGIERLDPTSRPTDRDGS